MQTTIKNLMHTIVKISMYNGVKTPMQKPQTPNVINKGIGNG